ncbi:alpha/beta fold hydrolase [Bacillus tuaregi]|uniref:alpha/beta fold hydrolase n=1 Tax=Bacillus tuaregi TaxID=1816695 RepID=UPI0008F85BE7|nr:alpha/beta hydrolase [Bacillus tuaregi]
MVEIGKYINANGINTHYHEAGQGEPLLLIHGSGPGASAWANWRLAFPALSEQFHLYAPDVVGFGTTERREGQDYSIDVWVNHMIDFIEAIGEKKVSIIGNSFGGAIALHLVYRRPDLVNRVVLMGSVGNQSTLSAGLDAVWGYTPSFDNMKNLIKIFSYDQSNAANDNLVEMRYQASIQEGFQEAFSSMFPAPRQRHLDAMALTDEQLKSIEKSVLLIHGREDEVIPLEETSWEIARLIPNAELHVFPHCGHWVQIEKTEEFIAQVIGFLKRTKAVNAV